MALEIFLNSDRNDDIRSEAAAFMFFFFRAGGATRVSTEEAQDVEDGTDEYVEIVAFKRSAVGDVRGCAKMRLSASDDKVLHVHREQEGWSPSKLLPDDLRAERDPSRS